MNNLRKQAKEIKDMRLEEFAILDEVFGEVNAFVYIDDDAEMKEDIFLYKEQCCRKVDEDGYEIFDKEVPTWENIEAYLKGEFKPVERANDYEDIQKALGELKEQVVEAYIDEAEYQEEYAQ